MSVALVTGSGSFLGRHLVSFLACSGVEVHSAGRAGSGAKRAVDWTNQASVNAVVESVRPAVIFHCVGSTQASTDAELLSINVGCAARILEAVEKASLRKSCVVALIGSAAEYGFIGKEQLPVTEETPASPITLYGLTKLMQTELGLRYARTGGRVVIARFFNLAGPGIGRHLFLGKLAEQVQRARETGETIKLGNMETARDYVWISDAVELLWKLACAPAAEGRVVNVCSGKALPISALLERMIKVAARNIPVQSDPELYRAFDSPVHYGNPAVLEKLTGCRPVVDVLEHIHLMLGAP